MLIPKKDRKEIYKYLFKEGVLWAPKDYSLPAHPEIESVKNLYVIKAMQSFESKELVTCRYAWRNYYWFITDTGIEYLREYLNVPAEVVPATLMKSTRPLERGIGGGDRGGDRGGRGGGRGDGPRRFEGGDGGGARNWRGGDREDYRGGEGGGRGFGGRGGGEGGEGRGFGGGRGGRGGGDKGGAPENYTPQFS